MDKETGRLQSMESQQVGHDFGSEWEETDLDGQESQKEAGKMVLRVQKD